MAFRSNPRQKFMGPSPWLQGAPPSALLPNPMQAQGAMMNQGPRQGMGFNPIVSQLALANNLLSSALPKSQPGFGGPGGRGILGSAPQHFQAGGPGMMRNMMMQGGPDPKRMRMGLGAQGIPPFNQRPRMPFPAANRPQNRNRDQPQQLFNRDRNQPRQGVKRPGTRWEEDKNKKLKPDDKPGNEKETSESKKDGEEIAMSSGDEKTYDPSSPTSDVEPKDKEETNNSDDFPEAGATDNKDEDAQGILQVTIQKGMKGRSVCKEGESGAASLGPNYCYACKVACSNQENFNKHMDSKSHKVVMDTLVALHEARTKHIEARMTASDQLHKIEEKERGKGSYCNICKSSYTGSTILHQRTSEHKKNKKLRRPFCPQCVQFVRSPAKFVQHCKLKKHKQALEEWTKEHGNEAGEWDTDEPEDKEQGTNADSSEIDIKPVEAESSELPIAAEKSNPVSSELDETNSKELTHETGDTGVVVYPTTIPPYDPEKQIGRESVVPLSGLFCKLCRKFYKDDDSAGKHCQSKAHYDNYKKNFVAAANLRKLKEKKEPEKSPEIKPKSILKNAPKPEEKKVTLKSTKAASKIAADVDTVPKEESQPDDDIAISQEADLNKNEGDTADDKLEASNESDLAGDKTADKDSDEAGDAIIKKELRSPTKASTSVIPKSPATVRKAAQRGRGRGRK